MDRDWEGSLGLPLTCPYQFPTVTCPLTTSPLGLWETESVTHKPLLTRQDSRALVTKDSLVVQLQGMRDWDLQLGVVILRFSIEMNPNTSHREGVCRLRLVNIRNWDTLENSNQLSCEWELNSHVHLENPLQCSSFRLLTQFNHNSSLTA